MLPARPIQQLGQITARPIHPEVTGMAKAGPPEFERDPVAESKP
jgi:hypothetical protein